MTQWTGIVGAEACEQRIVEIYGTDLRGDQGVVHVTSVWAESARSLITLRIGPETPPSQTDRFVLNVARARADAIITTGKILRDEGQVSHALQGPGDTAAGLAAWRQDGLRKPRPPVSLVLTSGRGLDLDHPLFGGGTVPMIFTSHEVARRVDRDARCRGIEVVGRESPSLRDAISYLRAARGADTIVVESGPTTSLPLYESPVVVDELMLSVYSEPRLSPAARGSPFLSLQQLGLVFPAAGSTYPSAEESGRWIFRRYTRWGSP